jgi:hypothetical protein
MIERKARRRGRPQNECSEACAHALISDILPQCAEGARNPG